MRIRFFLFVLVCFTMPASCNKGLKKPENFIEKDKMVEVLYDLALLGGMESTSSFSRDKTITQINVNSVLRKYDLDSVTFADNNNYYLQLMDGSYTKIQNEIESRLMIKKEELGKEEEERVLEQERQAKINLKNVVFDKFVGTGFKMEINDLKSDSIPPVFPFFTFPSL